MRKLTTIVLFFLLSLVTPAWGGGLALILSESGGAYGEFAGTLEETLSGSGWNIVSTTLADAPASAPTPSDLVVAVGSDALRKALSRADSPPIIATLIPRQSYERILAEYRRPSRITAIYLDQPPARQAAFFRQLFPDQKRFGLLASPETRSQLNQYRQAFSNAGLVLDVEDADTDKALLPALNAVLDRSAALLALPDNTIYRRNNIKAILITAFRHQRPIIGYSAAFVTAGALAALHTTPQQIARQTADLIISNGTSLPPPSGPHLFAIAINPNVAQALGLKIPDEAAIRRALLADRESR
ncbi:MAG TPA: ABC transporter substrate binding protein [Azonexus sp.]|nr:ABC transporter substrate binding protein [Azonexus sp.]